MQPRDGKPGTEKARTVGLSFWTAFHVTVGGNSSDASPAKEGARFRRSNVLAAPLTHASL
jgi:hypothetical protein